MNSKTRFALVRSTAIFPECFSPILGWRRRYKPDSNESYRLTQPEQEDKLMQASVQAEARFASSV